MPTATLTARGRSIVRMRFRPGLVGPTGADLTLSNLTDVAAARAHLGLGGAALLPVGTTAGSVAAGNDNRIVGAAQTSANLSDLTSPSAARGNLGLGDSATKATGTGSGTVAAGDDARITGAAQKASNLSDLASAPAARGNLGLGTVATLAAGSGAGSVPVLDVGGKLPVAALPGHDASLITSGTIDAARIPVLPSQVPVVSSGALTDLTAPQQATIVAGTVVTTTDGNRQVYGGSGSKTSAASYIVLADITPEWSAVQNKPLFGTASSRDTGTASGNVPVLDASGLLPSSVVPGAAAAAVTLPIAGVAAPQILTVLERTQGGELTERNWMPPAQYTNIRNRSCTVDLTSSYQAMVSCAEPVYVSSGVYPISDKATMTAFGKSLRGSGGLSGTTFLVRSDANLSATSFLQLYHFHTLQGIGFDFQQNMAASSRSQLINFPPAIDLGGSGVGQAQMRDICISTAMTGIIGLANNGGNTFDNVRIGALNKGLYLDGAKDFIKVSNFHFWPYGIAGNANLMALYSDGLVSAMDIGNCEFLNAASISTFEGAITFRNTASGNFGGTIGTLSLDGNGACLNFSGQYLEVGSMYSSKDGVSGNAAISQTMRISAGDVGIGTAWIDCNGIAEDVTVSGGCLTIAGGRVCQHNAGAQWARAASGGKIILGPALKIEPHPGFTQTRTQPFVVEDTGGVVVNHATFPWRSGDSGIAGYFANAVNSNSRQDQVSGWTISAPTGAKRWQYGTEDESWTAYTPTVSGASGLSTASGWYRQVGKTVTVAFDIAFGTVGSLGASLVVSLPVAAKRGFMGCGAGRETAISGALFAGTLDAGGSSAVFQGNPTAVNGNPIGNGTRFTHTFSYEAA